MEIFYGAAKEFGRAELGSWRATFASLLPLWLITLAYTSFGYTGFLLAIVVSILLLWKIWLTPELVLYSFIPLMLPFMFEEVYMSYRIPFLLLCTLVLTLGIIGYQRILTRSVTFAWLTLLLVAMAAWALASHATQNYWQMACMTGCFECSPGAPGCPPGGELTPWWILFFHF